MNPQTTRMTETKLTDAQIATGDYVCNMDHCDHEAITIIDNVRLCADHARLVRTQGGFIRAEVA